MNHLNNKDLIPLFLAPEEHKKAWGKETWIYNGPEFCGKILYFNKKAKFSLHFHSKFEVWYINKGKLLLRYFNLTNAVMYEKELNIGDVIKIPSFTPHQLEALDESEIIEISTQHFDEDSCRIGKGDSQKV